MRPHLQTGAARRAPRGPDPDGRLALADDATVIVAARDAPQYFALLFDRHAPIIHRYLVRRVGWQVADDLTAETFLAAFRKRDRYDATHRDARPWLYGIATNLVAQHRREEVRAYRLQASAPLDLAGADHAEQVVADVTAQSARRALAGALAQLAPGDRDVVLLVAWEELTYEEVARVLVIPVGTVRSRLHRARMCLRNQLEAIGLGTTVEEV